MDLVAVYRTNDGDLLIRICVSDVGFLHELRDRLLQGTLCRCRQAAPSQPFAAQDYHHRTLLNTCQQPSRS